MENLSSQQLLIVILVAVLVVGILASLAIVKGRKFRFGVHKKNGKIELGVEGEQKGPTGVGDIRDVKVLEQGKVDKAKVNIRIGHSVGKDQGHNKE